MNTQKHTYTYIFFYKNFNLKSANSSLLYSLRNYYIKYNFIFLSICKHIFYLNQYLK